MSDLLKTQKTSNFIKDHCEFLMKLRMIRRPSRFLEKIVQKYSVTQSNYLFLEPGSEDTGEESEEENEVDSEDSNKEETVDDDGVDSENGTEDGGIESNDEDGEEGGDDNVKDEGGDDGGEEMAVMW